mgnify:CR=1 FL=1
MKEKEEKRVPKLRFPEFTDDWEQRKLDEFVSFFSGLTYSPADIRQTGTLVLRSSNVKDGEVVDADNVYVDPAVVNSENVQDGDIIVVVRNGSRALIGKHAEIKGYKPNTVIGAFMTGIRSEHPSFLNALLNTSRFDQEVEMNMGATINQITGYMFSKMEFMVPSPEEQDAIGEYFNEVDHLITLHQRKLEKLKELKKGLVQKLFSQEVRFKADDGSDYPNWKTKKIDDVCTQIKETIDPMANPKKLFVEYSMPAFDNEMKPEVVYGNTMNSIRKVIGSPCVLINKLNVRKRRIWNIVNPEDNAVCSAEFVPLTSEVMNLSFVAYFALTDWFTRYLLECSTGSSNSQKRVTPDVILNIKMPIPCLAEQQKIVDCLSSLDHVIEKQKVTLAAWKELKKGLLQQMFV